MKVFISWSGEQSKQIASALRYWLPTVIQAAGEPYMSDEDNEAGTLWDQIISNQLEASNFGLVCLTPGNLTSSWIHFEAGALSKAVTDQARVVPLLYQLERSHVRQPLARFQMKLLDKGGVRDTVRSINSVLPEADRLKEPYFDQVFNGMWPDLESQLQSVPPGPEAADRSEKDMLKELLELVRSNSYPRSNLTNLGSLADALLDESRASGGGYRGNLLPTWLGFVAGPNGIVESDLDGFTVRTPKNSLSPRAMADFFAIRAILAENGGPELNLVEEEREPPSTR